MHLFWGVLGVKEAGAPEDIDEAQPCGIHLLKQVAACLLQKGPERKGFKFCQPYSFHGNQSTGKQPQATCK